MGFAHFLPTFPQPGGTSALIRALVDAGQRLGRDDEIFSYGGGHTDSRAVAGPRPSRLVVSSPVPLPLTRDAVGDRVFPLPGLDALVLHGVFTPSCARLSIESQRRRPGLAVIAYPHDAYDGGLFGTRSSAKRAYFATVERPYLRRAGVIVVAAPSHVGFLRDLGVGTTALVAPPGLSTDEVGRALDAGTVRSRRPPGSPLRLLALGRWDVHEKGLDLLCEAADDPSLRSRLSVRLVGPEWGSRPDVESQLRSHRLDNFEPVGYVDDAWTELIAADALVLPSRKEGFGLVALQALVSGLPVLLSTAAGMAEYVDDDSGVVLVDPTVDSVRAGLHDLVEHHGALTVAARAGSPRFAADFTSDRLVKQLVVAAGQV